jgi:SulP family sulfate permease
VQQSGALPISPWMTRLFPFLSWWSLLDREVVRADLMAGITAGVLILPQAIALATVAGLPVEYGLYTAIFPVIVTAFWGSSWHSLSGPNTALAVVTAATIAPFANLATAEYVQYAITLTFMVGVVQLAFGVLRLGVLFVYFSHTVMVALITSVGIIIVVQQIGPFLGLLMNSGESLDEILLQVFYLASMINPYALAVGTVTLATGLLVRRWRPRWPHYIMAVAAGMISAQLLDLAFGSAITQLDMVGRMTLDSLPLSFPDFSPHGFAEFSTTAYPAALSMAVLGLMQSAVIARSLAVKSGQSDVNINQETIGQGLSNVVGSFFSCFTSCGSFNRSAANLAAGARTPLAGLISAVVLGALVFFAAPLIQYLPISVMAAVLFLVGASLVKVGEIWSLVTTRGDKRWVFALVVAVSLAQGVSQGLLLGVLLSVVVHLRGASRPDVELLMGEEKDAYLSSGMEPAESTVVMISGELFFGSSQAVSRALSNLRAQDGGMAHLIIVGDYIQDIDSTAAEMLVQEARSRASAGFLTRLRLRANVMERSRGGDILRKGLGETGLIAVTARPE